MGRRYADGAKVFLESLADQTTLPWPGGFPGTCGASELRLADLVVPVHGKLGGGPPQDGGMMRALA